MEQKKILATLAMVGTLCAAHSAVPNNTRGSNAKKVTNINEKLLVNHTTNMDNSNSSHHINISADKVSDLKATGKVSSKSNTINVRNNPHDSSMVLGKLHKNSTIHITGKTNNWYKIKFNGNHGYIHSADVTTTNEELTTKNDFVKPSLLASSMSGTIYNLYQGISLHVRSGAGLNYSIIGDLHNGDTVNIISQIGNWYEINYNGQVAYVYASYVNTGSQTTSTSSSNASTGTVCNLSSGVYLHVRTGPSLDDRIIAYLDEGESVNILGKTGNWYKINYNGQIAYVYSSYVNDNSNTNTSASSTQAPAATSTGTVCNLNSGVVLHVRSGAGLDYSIIADLNEGATVNIIKQVGDWYEINYNGQIAYIYSAYVNTNNSSGNSNSNSSSNNSNNNNTPVPSTAYEGTVCNLSYGVNLHVRSGAGLDYNIIADLSEGATVNIIKKVGSWYEINYNGQVAYVYAYYVSPSNNDGNNNNSNSNNNNSNNNNGSKSTTGNNPYHLDFGKNSTVITTNYPGTLQQYINAQYNNWPYYSRSQYKNYINPASAKNIYQFLTINKFRNINVNKLNDALNGDGILSGQGQGFYDAAREFNIDPIYLVAQCLLETGRGTSYLASGVTIDKIANPNEPIYSNGVLVGYHMTQLAKPVTVYNLFGIGAYNNTSAFPNRALILGTTYAYTHGWTSVSSAISGAAQFVSQCYINNGSFGQITPYEFRYNPVLANIWHQYATTVWYGSSIGNLMKNLSYIYSEGDEFTFNIPVFKN